MQRSAGDDEARNLAPSDVSVAVADAPSTSGAHWANRDNLYVYRRETGRRTPFRRPNALNSFDPADHADESPRSAAASWWGTPSAAEPVSPPVADRRTAPDGVTTSRHAPRGNDMSDPDGSPESWLSPGPGNSRTAASRDDLDRLPSPAGNAEAQRPNPAGDAAHGGPQADTTGHTPHGDPVGHTSRADAGWASRGDADSHPLRGDDVGRTSRADSIGRSLQAEFVGRGSPSPFAAGASHGPGEEPVPPASRISYGVTDGPIGGYRPGYGPEPAPSAGSAGVRTNTADPAHRAGVDHPERPATTDPGSVTTPARSAPLVPPHTGHTGEIFDGPAREIRPHRALKDHTPPRGTPLPPGAPKRSRAVIVATLALGAVILAGAGLGGVAYFSGSDDDHGSVVQLGAGSIKGRTATAPLGGRTAAGFEMVAAAGKMTVRTEDLGGDLYRITTGPKSGMVPSPAISADRVQLHLTPDGSGSDHDVAVVLSSKVRWSLRFTAGADEQVVDLRGGQVSGIELIGGARRAELTLPRPAGTVPVRVTGALDELAVTSPTDAPIRVRLQSGAKTVAAGTRTLRDLAPGSTLTPRRWQVKDRYDVEAASRVTLLSVDPDD